jgi:pimeloyl-ACP methyl ester carboxylesterase
MISVAGRDVTGAKLPGNRLSHLVLAGLVSALIVIPAPAAEGLLPTPAPTQLALVAPSTLEARYQVNHANIVDATRLTDVRGDTARAAVLRSMADPARQILDFDDRGPGRVVEVFGDLASAERVSVLVPGSGTSLDTYESAGSAAHLSLAGGARALYDEQQRLEPDANVAVVAWLGYDTPDLVSIDVLTTSRAEAGAEKLDGFLDVLRQANPAADVALFGHSYGSVVVGLTTARRDDIADVAAFGSPGLGVSAAEDLAVHGEVWAAHGHSDWAADLPNVKVDLPGATLGFGPDPTGADFGASTFPTGTVGHGDYLEPGSVSLRSLALIALGRGAQATT